MSVRFFVYGGTRFGDRCKYGDWQEFPNMTLGDLRGISDERPSFGIGLHDKGPFLIYRRTSHISDRTYPLALLIDPGDSVWERFGWNAAAILSQLLVLAAIQRLTNSPEDITPDEVAHAISSLQPSALADNVPEQRAVARAVWAAIAFAPPETHLAFRPGDIGIPPSNDLDQIAAFLEGMPICYRIGHGWLMRGRLAQHEIGAGVVIDEEVERVSNAAAWIEAGQRHLEFAARLEQSRGGERWRRLKRTPVHLWEDLPANVLQQGEVLLNFSNVPSETLVTAADSGPFSIEIHDAIRDLVSVGTGPIGPGPSRLLLRTESSDALSRIMGRLDRTTLLAELLRRKLKPWSARSLLTLSDELVASLAWEYIRGAPPEDAPVLLGELCKSHPKSAQTEGLSGFLESALLNAPSLAPWAGFACAPIDELVSTSLGIEAVRRARCRAAGWQTDYLRFHADKGGTAVSDFLARDDWDSLLEKAVCQATAGSDGARIWLASLAESTVRAYLPIAQKQRIAKLIGGSWQPLIIIESLLRGDPLSAKAPPPDCEEALIAELEALAEQRAFEGFTPNLKALLDYPGSLPERLLKVLETYNPPIASESDLSMWTEGWKRLGRSDIAEREGNRFRNEMQQRQTKELIQVAEGETPSIEGKLLRPEAVRDALDILLFGRNADPDRPPATAAGRIPQLIRTLASGSQVLETVIVDRLPGNEERLWRRFRTCPESLEAVLNVLPEGFRSRIINDLIVVSEDFLFFLTNLIKRGQYPELLPEVTPLLKSAIEFLRSEGGRDYANTVKRWLRLRPGYTLDEMFELIMNRKA